MEVDIPVALVSIDPGHRVVGIYPSTLSRRMTMRHCLASRGNRMSFCAPLAVLALAAANPLTAWGAERVVLGEYFTWNG
jgi:hypothetical protein